MPKGALIGITIGIFGGLTFGIIVIISYDQQQESTSNSVEQGAALKIFTDKKNYRLQEPVHIRLQNAGMLPLFFKNDMYGIKVKALDGITLYNPSLGDESNTDLEQMNILYPAEDVRLTWNQTRSDGTSVAAGTYKIVSSFYYSSEDQIEGIDDYGNYNEYKKKGEKSVIINIQR